MGLIIVFAVLLAIFITLWILGEVFWWSDGLTITSVGFSSLSFLGLIVCIVVMLSVQIPKQKDYEQVLYEKQVLEYRLEKQEDDLTGNELLYRDIVELNNRIMVNKRYSDNFWIGLFYNDKIATIDYIEIEGVGNYTD